MYGQAGVPVISLLDNIQYHQDLPFLHLPSAGHSYSTFLLVIIRRPHLNWNLRSHSVLLLPLHLDLVSPGAMDCAYLCTNCDILAIIYWMK